LLDVGHRLEGAKRGAGLGQLEALGSEMGFQRLVEDVLLGLPAVERVPA
jgi:hypothetical protein